MPSCCWRRVPTSTVTCLLFSQNECQRLALGLASYLTSHCSRTPAYKTHRRARHLCLSLVGPQHPELSFHMEGDLRNQPWMSACHMGTFLSPDVRLELAFSYPQLAWPVGSRKTAYCGTQSPMYNSPWFLLLLASAGDSRPSPGVRKMTALHPREPLEEMTRRYLVSGKVSRGVMGFRYSSVCSRMLLRP